MIKNSSSLWGITTIIGCLLILSSCKTTKQTSSVIARHSRTSDLEARATILNLQETKGKVIDGYTLQDNDRVYFNAIRNYVQGKFDTAFVTLNYYNKLDSTNAAAYYYLASLKGRANFLKPTLTDAGKAASLAPDNKWIQAFYANILAFDESYDKSAQIFSDLAAKNPADRAQYYIAAAKMYSRSKNYAAALKVLDTLQLTRPPDDEDILMEKQSIYMTSKDLPNAIKVTQQLADAYPLSPEYLIQLNEIYEIQGNTEQSLATIKLLQDRFPYNDDITSYTFGYYLKKRNMEMVTESLNEYIDAAEKNQEKDLSILSQIGSYISNNPKDTAVLTFMAELTEKITVQKPNNFTAKRLLASLNLFSRKGDLGLQQSEALIKDRPHNYALWTPVLSYYLYYTNDQDATLKFLDRMEVGFPDSIDIPMNKMFIYRAKDKIDTALKYAFKGLDLSQKQKATEREIIFYNSIAEYYNELKQYQKSDSVFEDLLKKAPDNIMALNNYAYYLSERGERLEYALNLSKKTLEQQYDEPNYLDTYGWILYKMKRYEEAKVYIEKAITNAGNDVTAVVLEHYADIEFQLGHVDNALKIWKAIDEAGQGSALLKKKIKDKKLYE
jgi:tetratricopeptide (TPR) repeat protein